MAQLADFSGATHIYFEDLTDNQKQVMRKAGYKTCVFHLEGNGRIILEGNGGHYCIGGCQSLSEVINYFEKKNKEKMLIEDFKALLTSLVMNPQEKIAKFGGLSIDGETFAFYDADIKKHKIPVNFSQSEIDQLVQKLNLAIQHREAKIAANRKQEQEQENLVEEFKRLYKKSLKTKKDLQAIEEIKKEIQDFLPSWEFNRLIDGIF